jgi:hypothetical protein
MKNRIIKAVACIAIIGGLSVVSSNSVGAYFEGCKVSKSGRVSCSTPKYNFRVWNNGRARGYYYP